MEFPLRYLIVINKSITHKNIFAVAGAKIWKNLLTNLKEESSVKNGLRVNRSILSAQAILILEHQAITNK